MAKNDDNNKPNYIIKMKPKDRNISGWTKIGVGWDIETGVKLTLDRGVILDWHDMHSDFADNYIVMLFTND